MIVELNDIASVGLVKDTPAELLPSKPLAWTVSQNVRFNNGQALKMGGSSTILQCEVTPYHYVRLLDLQNEPYLIYCGLQKVYMFHSGTHYNITRTASDYNADTSTLWQSTQLNNQLVLNNGVDAPQQLVDVDTSSKLEDLANWPASTTAKIIRSFKSFLIAANITKSTAKYPSRVWWSASALPGQLPSDWDYTDPASESGFIDLSDEEGPVIEMEPLGDSLIIYKSNSTYVMQYIGGTKIFAIKKLFSNSGILSKECVVEVNNRHYVLTTEDVVELTTGGYQSIAANRVKDYLFASFNSQLMGRSYVVENERNNEIWFCIASGASDYPTKVFVYNYKNNVWYTRITAPLASIASSLVDVPSVGTYDSYTSTVFNQANFNYDSSRYNKLSKLLVATDYQNDQLILVDDTISDDTAGPLTAMLERSNLLLSEDQGIKTIKRLWPKMTVTADSLNSTVKFYIGTQMRKNDAIDWQGPYDFNIRTDQTVDLFATGRYLSIRILSNTSINWALENIDIDVMSAGRW